MKLLRVALMTRIVNLLSIFFALLCSGQSWGLVVTPEDNIYRYDASQIATDRQNYDYGVALNFRISDHVKHLLDSADNAKGTSFFAFVGGFFVTRGAAKASDGLGSLLNSSKFDRLLSSKGRAIQFQNRGNARNAFDQLRTDLGVSADDVVRRPGGVTTFRSGNRTFTLRSDSAGGNTVSVVTDNNPQQIVIRFGQE